MVGSGDKRRRFDLEFLEGAVRIVMETGMPVVQVARDLGISPYTLRNGVELDREWEGESGVLDESERVTSSAVVYESVSA